MYPTFSVPLNANRLLVDAFRKIMQERDEARHCLMECQKNLGTILEAVQLMSILAAMDSTSYHCSFTLQSELVDILQRSNLEQSPLTSLTLSLHRLQSQLRIGAHTATVKSLNNGTNGTNPNKGQSKALEIIQDESSNSCTPLRRELNFTKSGNENFVSAMRKYIECSRKATCELDISEHHLKNQMSLHKEIMNMGMANDISVSTEKVNLNKSCEKVLDFRGDGFHRSNGKVNVGETAQLQQPVVSKVFSTRKLVKKMDSLRDHKSRSNLHQEKKTVKRSECGRKASKALLRVKWSDKY